MNPLVLQLAVSFIGIALMIGLCWALFGGGDTLLDGAETAAARIARDVAFFRPGRAALSRDRRAALVEDARDGEVYLAVVRGDGIVTRKLSRGVAVTRDGERLHLMLDDFTLNGAELELSDAAFWEARLRA